MSVHLPGGIRLRRYPALAFLVVAAVLATLLPSALLIPLSGPSASAELAPVPGKSDGAGDLSALGETSTGGLGSGSGAGGEDRGRPDTDDDGAGEPPGSGKNLRNKRCVGKPARQTEDPLSPTCVPYFAGDNGGATAPGVSGQEISVVIDQCANSGEPDVEVDYDDENDPNAQPDVKAYVNHFNARYQFYGRRLHVHGIRWSCSPARDTDRRARAQRLQQRFQPFAVIPSFHSFAFADEAARLGILNLVDSPLREFTAARAPYVYSVYADLDEQVGSLAEFVCRRLADHPARYSGDATAQGRTRRFGLYYRVQTDPASAGSAMLRRRLRDGCGVEMTDYSGQDWDNAAPAAAAAMRTDGVTTVVAMDDHLWPSVAASSIGWHPEWVVRDAGTLGTGNVKVTPPEQLRNTIGITFRRRFGLLQQQPAYTAAADGCSGCGEHTNPYLYEDLLLLARGVQAAGPRLTAANVDRGLHALAPHRSLDPYRPAAYLGPNDHFWFKDAMAWWWDPAGTPPDGEPGGCWRLVEDGARYRTEDWRLREGDAGFKGSDGTQQPCQGGS